MSAVKAMIGLGNPGPKYEWTRHNVGFWAIDILAKQLQVPVTRSKHQSLVGESRIGDSPVLLVKPQTFMNLSGQAVQEIVHYYKLDPTSDVIVVYDDMDFQPGQLKLRTRGSAGGHNGIKSIISSLGTEEFCRVRLGISRPAPGVDIISHVLGTFRPEDKERVWKAAEASVDAIRYCLAHDFERAMSRFNQVSFE
jgi:peptidyl-tRNA hydrolase, PTH1 family